MSELDEITSRIEALRGAVDTAKGQVEAALNDATDKAEQAAALGVEAVAATVQSARDDLEAAASSLGSAHDAAGHAASGLGEITTRTGSKEAADRIAPVIGQLDQAATDLGAAAGSADNAHNHAQQAEIDSLIAIINTANDSIGAAHKAAGPPRPPRRRTGSGCRTWETDRGRRGSNYPVAHDQEAGSKAAGSTVLLRPGRDTGATREEVIGQIPPGYQEKP